MRGALTFELEGHVRTPGFRPAVWRMASEEGLSGWIKYASSKALLHLEGDDERIKMFISSLPARAPRSSKIEAIRLVSREQPPGKAQPSPRFRILDELPGRAAPLPALPRDLALCAACSREIQSKGERRFAYAFASCPACGPGLTVLQQTPCERSRMTMAAFPICHSCKAEYDEIRDRHFKTETLACHDCGPQLFITDAKGEQLIDDKPLATARCSLAEGKIVAVRSLGGFQLAADAFNRQAVATLRKRKKRSPLKPFAVMARDFKTVKAYCECPPEAEALLNSKEAPIVVLRLKPSQQFPKPLPADLISPDGPTLGVMLPFSPLHKLLFEQVLDDDPTPPFEFLIMTRGDRGGEPTCVSNEDAFEKLGRIADLFLCNDREISVRNDDSVCAIRNGAPQIWRRARGFAPAPVKLKAPLKRAALGMGSDTASCVALACRDMLTPSPHIGNLDSTEAEAALQDFTVLLPTLLDSAPEAIAIDMNPEMHSSAEGLRLAEKWGLPVVKVQHHFAHALACMAENKLESALALVFDGAGTGTDGTIWGAELLEVSLSGFKRLASFAPAPLPGGGIAISRPTRQLIGRFQACGMKASGAWLERLGLDEAETQIWHKQCERRLNAPLCHSAGRLFDAVSVILGLAPDFTCYDGQTAIRLEYAALRGNPSEPAPDRISEKFGFEFVERSGFGIVDWTPLFKSFAEPVAVSPQEMPEYAVAFHCAVAKAAAKMLEYGMSKSPCRDVVLSGGVFTNRLLCELVPDYLAMLGLNVHTHRQLPPNDGGLSAGQAYFAGMNS